MKCQYCGSEISFIKFYPHYLECKRNRKRLIIQKINRNLTVPSANLISLIERNLVPLEEVLSQDKFYRNVYSLQNDSQLNLEEAIAVNNLFWHAHTPFYSAKLVPGWLYLGRLRKDDKGIYAVCSDWRTGPPDSIRLPIDMIPAEILAEALSMIGLTVDVHSFSGNQSYQEYIENKYNNGLN